MIAGTVQAGEPMTVKEMGAVIPLEGRFPFAYAASSSNTQGRRVRNHIHNSAQKSAARVLRAVLPLETRRGRHSAGMAGSA